MSGLAVLRTHNKKLWLGGGALTAVLLVLIGWFLLIEPELTAASSSRELAESIQTQNDLLAANNTKLKLQNDNIAALRADLAAALAQLPSDGGLPEFTRQISAQATAASVVLNSMVVGAASAVAAPAVGTDSTETATTDTGDTADPGTSTLADPETASGLVELTITVTATGLGADNLAFLQAIALTGPRSALLSETQLAPVESGDTGISGPSTLTVTLTIFSAPLPAADQVALEKLLSGG